MDDDVCRVLDHVNTTQAVPTLNKDEARVQKLPDVNRGANIISESGLYKLIMRSNKPQAKAFQIARYRSQDWVS